jgi:hypothetical protein
VKKIEVCVFQNDFKQIYLKWGGIPTTYHVLGYQKKVNIKLILKNFLTFFVMTGMQETGVLLT